MPTVTQLLSDIRDMLDEPTSAQWTDNMLRKWINEGNRDLARSTKHLKGTANVNTIAGVSAYVLASSIVAIEHAYYDDGSRQLPLTPTHMESFDAIRGYSHTRQGIPSHFTTQGFAPSLSLVVYPVPSVSIVSGLKLLTARLPTEFAIDGSGDAGQVDTPTAWYDALADYCEFKALRRDRDPRWQEAYQLYQEKRDGLINNNDYHTANREMVPDANAGYLPKWLVEFDA